MMDALWSYLHGVNVKEIKNVQYESKILQLHGFMKD